MHMSSSHLPFLCKACITNITIERPFLPEMILVQEAHEKFEPFDDKNAIRVKFWSFMFLCYIQVQPWKASDKKPEAVWKDWWFRKASVLLAKLKVFLNWRKYRWKPSSFKNRQNESKTKGSLNRSSKIDRPITALTKTIEKDILAQLVTVVT